MMYNSYCPQPYNFSFNPPSTLPIFHQPELKKVNLSINLPTFEYIPSKTPIVPLVFKNKDDCLFSTIDEAMKFIGKHCVRNHGSFTNKYARIYSSFCFIFDIISGGYYPMSEAGKREFNSSFQRINSSLEKYNI